MWKDALPNGNGGLSGDGLGGDRRSLCFSELSEIFFSFFFFLIMSKNVLCNQEKIIIKPFHLGKELKKASTQT